MSDATKLRAVLRPLLVKQERRVMRLRCVTELEAQWEYLQNDGQAEAAELAWQQAQQFRQSACSPLQWNAGEQMED